MVKTYKLTAFYTVFISLLCFLVACSQPDSESSEGKVFENYTMLGDLSDVVSKGVLRVAAETQADSLLRDGMPAKTYSLLAEEFAASLGVELEWIFVDHFDQLLPLIETGQADLLASNLTVTSEREARVRFSIALSVVDEVLLYCACTENPLLNTESPAIVTVAKGTSFVGSLIKLQQDYPQLEVDEVSMTDEQILDAVGNGALQATVQDSNVANGLLSRREDLVKGAVIAKGRKIAWAVQRDAVDLQQSLNQFLVAHHLSADARQTGERSWQDIKNSGELRVLTSNNPASYFLWRGELMGFDYELISDFAKAHDLRVNIIVRNGIDDLFLALKSGEGDLIAASVTRTGEREKQGLMFSHPYLYVQEQLVGRSQDDPFETAQDLSGKTVVVHPSAAFVSTLKLLQAQGVDVLIEYDNSASTENLINKVASGEIDYTIADSHLVAIEQTYRDDIAPMLDVTTQSSIAWVMRPDQNKLKSMLDVYIKKQYKQLFYNLTFNKYFRNKKRILRYAGQRIELGSDLSPYDSLVQSYAIQSGYDWRLLVSQMYQESRFNPEAESFAGAVGLMQVLPRTANQFGYKKLTQPDQNVAAAVAYLDWLQERFPEDLPLQERLYFILASYNAGHGHVRDARRLASQLDMDANKWFDNVEKAMLLLSKPEYYRKARFGYVRGSEPVAYVRGIRNRYFSYIEATTDRSN